MLMPTANLQSRLKYASPPHLFLPRFNFQTRSEFRMWHFSSKISMCMNAYFLMFSDKNNNVRNNLVQILFFLITKVENGECLSATKLPKDHLSRRDNFRRPQSDAHQHVNNAVAGDV